MYGHEPGRLSVRLRDALEPSIEQGRHKERCAWLSHGAMKHVKAYLRIRPVTAKDERLWLKADGLPLSYSATNFIMRSLKQRSGIARVHWHFFRHGFAQHALRKGAEIGTVQGMCWGTPRTP